MKIFQSSSREVTVDTPNQVINKAQKETKNQKCGCDTPSRLLPFTRLSKYMGMSLQRKFICLYVYCLGRLLLQQFQSTEFYTLLYFQDWWSLYNRSIIILATVQSYSNWPIVDQCNIHHGSKDSIFHIICTDLLFQFFQEQIIQIFRGLAFVLGLLVNQSEVKKS